MKLLNFIGLLFSVARLLWRALCFSWNHGGQLRDLTDELRKVVTDGQLAVHGVTLGTATLKLVNAHSVPVQALTDQARHLLETDLPGTALAAAGTALDVTEAQRVELNKLVLALQRVLAKPALVEKSLAVANRTLAVADTQDSQVTDLLRALEHVLAQQTLAASTLPVMTKALDVMTTSLTTPMLIAINSQLLPLLGTPVSNTSLGVIEKALKVARDNQADLLQTIAALTDLLGRSLPAKSLELSKNALRVAAQHEANVQGTIETLTNLLQSDPVDETFTLAEKGATLYWKNSKSLLTLFETSGLTLETAGTAEVMASYLLNGSEAKVGASIPLNVTAPTVPAGLDTANTVKAVQAAVVGVRNVENLVAGVAVALRGSVKFDKPTGIVGDDANKLTVLIPLGGQQEIFTGWKVNTEAVALPGVTELAATLDDDPAQPATGNNTVCNRIAATATSLGSLEQQLKADSKRLFANGVALISTGKTLRALTP